jgi:hypothetical protein
MQRRKFHIAFQSPNWIVAQSYHWGQQVMGRTWGMKSPIPTRLSPAGRLAVDEAARTRVRVERVSCCRVPCHVWKQKLMATPSSSTPLPFRIAVCYHAFFFGSFYFLFSLALVFKLAWCSPLPPPSLSST